MSNLRKRQEGFTAIEMLITIVVAGMLIISFYMLYMVISTSAAQTRSRADASDLAYSYLRKYASANSSPTWFVCDTTTGSGNTNDRVMNSNATGQVLEEGELTTNISGIPKPVNYKVTALAIYGCNGPNINKPLRIESEITYGPTSRVVKHATIMGYQ